MASNGVQQRFRLNNSKRNMAITNKSECNYQNVYEKNRDDSQMEAGVMQKKLKEQIRFIKKSGRCNVSHSNLNDRSRRFLADIFTTGVDLQWRWNLFVFGAAFVISWLLFGLVFWVLSYVHGDFEPHLSNSTFTPCIRQLDVQHPFTSTFLFSLETQTTIGYGYRHVTEECWLTIVVVVLQSVFGCIIDAFMIGLIMAKISRPKKRAETLLFSRNAVINVRDGRLCLMIRVGNLRKSHLVEATIRMQYVYARVTVEGEQIPIEQVDLNLDIKNDSDRLFLVTPQTICHPIDDESPLWDLTAEGLNSSEFEVIVVLEGMVEATGMTTQARASYLPSEILWGHRFQNMISVNRNNAYKVNFKKFHDTYFTPDAPQCSAKELYELSKHPRLDPMVSLRSRRANNKSGSESSSSRSSTASQRLFSPSEGMSGIGNCEGLSRSESKGSINKAMTSTTSLSEDCSSLKMKRRGSTKSTSSSLIDLFNSKPLKEEEKCLVSDEEEWDEKDDIDEIKANISRRSSSSSIHQSEEKELIKLDSINTDVASNTLPENISDDDGFASLSVEKAAFA